jgi:hypothetical protein
MYCLFCDVLCIVYVYMCTVLLPPGGYPIAVNKYIYLSDWVDRTFDNDVLENTRISCPCRDSNSGSSNPYASHYTDWVTRSWGKSVKSPVSGPRFENRTSETLNTSVKYTGVFELCCSDKPPTRCNNFSFYYPDVYLQLNMFRAFSAHHQELDDCSGSLWFYLRIVVKIVLCS